MNRVNIEDKPLRCFAWFFGLLIAGLVAAWLVSEVMQEPQKTEQPTERGQPCEN